MEKCIQNPSAFLEQASADFAQTALSTFKYQFEHISIYRSFCEKLNRHPEQISKLSEIPFLPISFFKTFPIKPQDMEAEKIFESSGTSGQLPSRHHIVDLRCYSASLQKGFELFWGNPADYCFLALLPSYLERENASLVYMVEQLMAQSKHPDNGFYLHDLPALSRKLRQLEKKATKTMLIGVSFALLELARKFPQPLNNTILMETGGMKGRGKELIREELHNRLKSAFGLSSIASEYGMTELLSQAYSKSDGIYTPAPWMQFFVRDLYDPFSISKQGTGAINIIDLANINSCSFIATDDLGKLYPDGRFEILGRMDNSDLRGCNLLLS